MIFDFALELVDHYMRVFKKKKLTRHYNRKNIEKFLVRHDNLSRLFSRCVLKILRSNVVMSKFGFFHFPRMILRPAPRFCPAWLAPLFDPACSPMMPSPALSCSSVNSRLFSSAGFGPKCGPGHSGCLYDWKTTIANKFLFF